MSRSSAPQVLDRPGSAHEVSRPALDLRAIRASRRAAPAAKTETAATTETATSEGSGSSRPGRFRRLPHPPGRRAPLWFAALVAGAVLAGLPSLTGGTPQVVTADASDYGLGVASDLGLTGSLDDADVRRGLTQAEAQARLSELAASRAAREPKTVLPVQGTLTTCYCMRWGQMHYGIDLAAPLGTPIYAAVDGVVIRAGSASGFGNAVYIQDADGNVHIYGHMRYYSVQAGDIVHAGDEIAKVGNEGYSTGPHLHYEIHRGGENGRPIDSQEYLAERGVQV